MYFGAFSSFSKGLLITLALPLFLSAQSNSTIIVSTAGFGPAVAPGSIAAIFGANLANTNAAASLDAKGNLPNSLAGSSVSVNGQTASLIFVSPGQINFVMPENTAVGSANISVSSPASSPAITGTAQVKLAAPGIFTITCLRTDRAAAENGITGALEPFQATTAQNPTSDKRTVLSVYGTGFRFADNSARDSSIPVTSHVTAQIIDSNGNVYPAIVEYAGAQFTLAGLDQLNILLPAEVDGLGLVTLQVSVDGVAVRPVTIIMGANGAADVPESGLTVSTVASQLSNPAGVAFDAADNLYIADAGNHVVRMLTPAGVMSTFAGTGTAGSSEDGSAAASAQLQQPVALAFDPLGDLYIADSADNRVRIVSTSGIMTTAAGNGTAGYGGDDGPAIQAELNSPGGIAVDSTGTLYIADTGNNRIRRVTADGLISTVAGTGTAGGDTQTSAYLAALNAPSDVAVDAQGDVMVADAGNYIVRRVGADGGITTIAGEGTAGSSGTNCAATQAQFSGPVRLATDGKGRLIVSDTKNQLLRIIDAGCEINNAAGTGTAGFGGDGGGNAAVAQFNNPLGVATDANGNIMIADSGNQRVRSLSVAGAVPAVSFHPAAATAGQTVQGYVSLGSPSSSPTTVALASSAPVPGLATSLTIPAGTTTGVISFAAPNVDAETRVTITASGPGVSASGTLVAMPAPSSAGTLGSLGVGSSSIGSSETTTGTLTLTQPAPKGGTAVSVQSDNPAVQVASSVTVPAGLRRAQILIATPHGAAPGTATITASGAGSAVSASLNVGAGGGADAASGTIASVAIPAGTVVGGQSATGSVSLIAPAAAPGVAVSLASDTAGVTVPASVTVAEGATSGTFPVNTLPVSGAVTATITAASANVLTATLSVAPASAGGGLGTVAEATLGSGSVTGGQTANGTITLAMPAGAGGVTVGLVSSVASATVPSSVTVPAGSMSAAFAVTTSPVATAASGLITVTSANSVSVPVVVLPESGSGGAGTVASVSLNPTSIVGGQSATGTVTLASAAASGGVAIGLASSVPGVSVPASLVVPSGATSATFTVTTSPVTSAASGTITATGANSVSVPVSVQPSASSGGGTTGTVSGLTLNPSSITGGQSSTGTVTLASAAGSGGVTVGLASSLSSAVVPASVTVPSGSTSATFTVTTSAVTTPVSGSLTASSANSISVPVSVQPASSGGGGATGTVATVSINPASITGGQSATGTVTLAGAAGSGGVTVGLASSLAGVSVPASVTVPSGSTSTTFTVTTQPVTTAASGTITASSANSISVPVSVQPSSSGGSGSGGGAATGTVTGLSLNPSSITGGQPATGTITLASAAGSGGVSIGLSSSLASASVPASVTVPAGSTSATFTVTTSSVTSAQSGTITATSANSLSTGVSVNPASGSGSGGAPTSVSFSPSSVTGGQSATGTVAIASPAPAGGVTVSLSSSSASVTVPSSVTVAAGQSTATFMASTTPVNSTTTATITASGGGTSSAGSLTVNPPCPAFISAGIGTPNLSGIPLTLTTTLNGAAPSGGTTVNFASGSTGLGSVTIPAGQSSASTNLTVSGLIGVVGGSVNALSNGCPLISGTIH